MKTIRENSVYMEYPQIFLRFQEGIESVSMPHLHYHDGYEIYIMLDGEANYILSDKTFSLYSNTFILVNPYVIHKKIAISKSYTTILVNFNNKMLERYFAPQAIKNILKPYTDNIFGALSPRDVHKILALKNPLLKVKKNEEASMMYLAEMLSVLANCTPLTNMYVEQSTSLDKKIYEYVADNLEKKITLDILSKEFLMSKQSLISTFKKNFGTSPIYFVNHVKMNFARSMLQHPEFDIKTISQYCGYKSQSYFTKVYKEVFGVKPLNYRKEFEKNA